MQTVAEDTSQADSETAPIGGESGDTETPSDTANSPATGATVLTEDGTPGSGILGN